MTQPHGLLHLPPELLDEILSYLPYTSLLSLSWTSIPLYNFLHHHPSLPPARWKTHTISIPPNIVFSTRHAAHFTDLSPNIPTHNEVLKREQDGQLIQKHEPGGEDRRRCMLDLLVLETWPGFMTDALVPGGKRKRNMYACASCLKLRHISLFTTAQVSGSHGKGPATEGERGRLLRLQDCILDNINDDDEGACSGGTGYGFTATGVKYTFPTTTSTSTHTNPLATTTTATTTTKKHTPPPSPSETRFCIPCGVRTLKYQKGVLLRFFLAHDPAAAAPAAVVAAAVVAAATGHTTPPPRTPGDDREAEADREKEKEKEKQVIGTGIVCKRCGRFKVMGAETKGGIRRLCLACLAYRPI